MAAGPASVWPARRRQPRNFGSGEIRRRGRAIMRPMSDLPVGFSPGGLPETVLHPAPDEARHDLEKALALDGEARRAAISAVVARFPRFLDGWARLGENEIGRAHV